MKPNKTNKTLAWLLAANKVWRAYRIVPTVFTGFCLYMVYTTMHEANMMNASWDLGAVLGGMGLLIERVLSAYTKTGNDQD